MVTDHETALATLKRVREMLAPISEKSGGVLLSGIDTLVKGDYYVMGFNPGGDPVKMADETIAASLDKAGGRVRWNEWAKEAREGRSVFAKCAVSALDAVGAEPNRTFCTNAIFVRSVDADSLQHPWQIWWEYCWPVHKLFLSIVRPQLIVCLGDYAKESAWAMLRLPEPPINRRYTSSEHWQSNDHEAAKSGRYEAGVTIRYAFHAEPCAVLGLPHPNSQEGGWIQSAEGWTLAQAAREKAERARMHVAGERKV